MQPPRLPRSVRNLEASVRRAVLRLPFTAAAILTVAFGCVGAASSATLTDAQILGIYIQVNDFDIETALLGRSQAAADEVRQLAAHVANDHVGVRDGAFSLAQTCKVRPVLPEERTAAASDHSKVMSELLLLKGPAFDDAYLRHELAFHRAAIRAVRIALLPAVSCPQLREHLNAVLPAFENHLAQTGRLFDALHSQ